MSTKHLKNRHFNQGLKNIASWGYWQGAGRYGVGTAQEGVPYFEALSGLHTYCIPSLCRSFGRMEPVTDISQL